MNNYLLGSLKLDTGNFKKIDKIIDSDIRMDKYMASRPWTRDHWRNHYGSFTTNVTDELKRVTAYLGTFMNPDDIDEVPYLNEYLVSVGEEPIQNVSDLDERTAYNYRFGRDWTNRIDRSARPYKNVPSAITSRDGIKNNMSKTNKSKTIKKFKKGLKKFRKRKAGKVAQTYRKSFNRAMRGRAPAPSAMQRRAMGALSRRRGMKFGAGNKNVGLYKVPLAMGRSYSGYAGMMTSNRANCMNFKSRMFMGTLNLNVGTDRLGTTSQNVVLWRGNGTDDNHGQFFFGPGNDFYNPGVGNYNTMAHMFSTYILNNISFTFESQIMPGNSTQTRINYGFFQDVNYGEAQFGSGNYFADDNLIKLDVMNLPTSKNFPAWEPTYTISPPPRMYRGQKKKIVSLDNDAKISFSEVHAGTNNNFYAFGMWIYIDHGDVVGGVTAVADVFMNIDIDFCDMVSLQRFDASGSPTLKALKTAPDSVLDKALVIINGRKAHAEFKKEEKEEKRINQEIAQQWDNLEKKFPIEEDSDQLQVTEAEQQYLDYLKKKTKYKQETHVKSIGPFDHKPVVFDIEDGGLPIGRISKPSSVLSDYVSISKEMSDNKIKSNSNK